MDELIAALISLFQAEQRTHQPAPRTEVWAVMENLRIHAVYVIQRAVEAGIIGMGANGAVPPPLRRALQARGTSPTEWASREGGIHVHLRFMSEGIEWTKMVVNRIAPRAGEMIQLDSAGRLSFKVEYVVNQLGNDSVVLYCTVERLECLIKENDPRHPLEAEGFTKVPHEKQA